MAAQTRNKKEPHHNYTLSCTPRKHEVGTKLGYFGTAHTSDTLATFVHLLYLTEEKVPR